MNQPVPFDRMQPLALPLSNTANLRPWSSAQVWDDLARVLLLALALVAALTFRDYAITNDEEVQHIYGQKLLSFYLSGFSDWSAFAFKDLFLYGGLFDLLAVIIAPFSTFEEYETRHLLCAAIGILGIAGTWRLGRLVAGPRAGLLAAALLALSGVYYGAMFNNTKDVPFAAGMVWTLYYATRIVQQSPRPGTATVLKFGVALGLTLGIRVGALFAPVYLAMPLLGALALTWRAEGRAAALSDARGLALALLPALPVAYGLMALLWPWSVFETLNPLKALFAFATFSHLPFTLQTLFDGQLVMAVNPPCTYLPVYLAIKLPEAVIIGAALSLVTGGWWLWRRCQAGTILAGSARRAALMHASVLLAVAMPIVLFMIMRPTVYNGIRHFLFVVPPMIVLAAAAFDRAWRWAESHGALAARTVTLVLTGMGVLYAYDLGAMHPNEYVYYNRFVGGVKGAAQRFELDYWGNSMHEGVTELIALVERENDGKAPPRNYTLAVCGNTLAVTFELPPWLKLVTRDPDWRRADFFIAFTQVSRCPSLLDGQPVIEVAVEGVPLTVVKDRRP